MIGPLFTYWSKMDTLIFTVGPGASPCNATIIWQHKHMSKLLVALRSIELQNMTGINNTNNRSVIMKSHVCSYSVCSPFSVFHQAVEGNPRTLCYCNSRVLVHIYHAVLATYRWSWSIRQCCALIAPFRYGHSFCYALYSPAVPRVHQMHRHIFNGPTSKYSSRQHLDCCLQSYALKNDSSEDFDLTVVAWDKFLP